jgi:hypothetical protein
MFFMDVAVLAGTERRGGPALLTVISVELKVSKTYSKKGAAES